MSERALRRLRVAILALVACMSSPALGFHSTFSSSLDRFEVDGNVYGAFDGVPDFVDEFDDDVVGTGWDARRQFGTATESSDVVTFHDPGRDLMYHPTTDMSAMIHEVPFEDEAGSHTVTAYWTPVLPGTDRRFHLQIIGQDLDTGWIEAAGISVTNLTPQTALAYWNGSRVGYAISQERSQLSDGYGALEIVQYDSVGLDPESITGAIMLRLSLDDVTDILTTSFSLDGGATFQSPFPALPVYRFGVVQHRVLVGAAAVQAGEPPHPTNYLELRSFEVRTRASLTKVKLRAKHWNIPLWDYPTDGGATVNVLLDGVARCFAMPASGWIRTSYSTFRYDDRDAVHGPVRKAYLSRANGTFEVRVDALGGASDIGLAPPNPGTRVETNFETGGLTDYCSSSVGGRIRANHAKAFKVEKGPPPASCGVPACTP